MTDRVFTLPVIYWPSRTGVHWWPNFREAEVRRDLDLVAMSGLTSLALELDWGYFQPEPGRLAASALHNLSAVLRIAADLNLSSQITAAPAMAGGLLWLPSWALDPFGESPQDVLV